MKTAGEIVCDNRELFHPEAIPVRMIDLVRSIQADALRRATEIVNEFRVDGDGDLRSLRGWIESEAERTERGDA